MKFFIPTVKEDQVENFLDKSILPFIESLGFEIIKGERIYSITFQHDGTEITDTVGQLSPSNNEPIFLILETKEMYLICTRNRGILGGEPMLTGKHSIDKIEYFDNTEKDTYKYGDWIYKLRNGNHEVEFPLELPNSLYKYYNNNSNSRKAFLNQYLFCSHPYHLNDSMDCNNLLWDFSNINKRLFDSFCEFYHKSPFLSERRNYEDDKVNNFEFIKTAFWNIVTNKAGIISLSETPLHTLMWSHYASEKGFMIEFNRVELIELFKKMNPNFKNYVFMPIQYVDTLEMIDFFSNNFTSPDVPFLYSINIKKSDWQYEKEWRLVCYSESFGIPNLIISPKADTLGKIKREYFYNKNSIISITLGKYFFNGSNLKDLIYPNTYVIKDSEDLKLIDFIYNNHNDKLFISNEIETKKKFLRNRIQIELEKLDDNIFKMNRK